jgi:hypothetical protein
MFYKYLIDMDIQQISIIKRVLTVIYYSLFIFFIFNASFDISGLSVNTSGLVEGQILAILSANKLFYCLGVAVIFATFLKSRFVYEAWELKIFHNPYTMPCLTLGALLAGIYTSVTSSAILTWLSGKSLDPTASPDIAIDSQFGMGYFIFSFVILFLGFVKHGVFSARAERDKQIKQTESVNKLEEVIRLAPPGSFSAQLSTYADILEDWSSSIMVKNLTTFHMTIDHWDFIPDEHKDKSKHEYYNSFIEDQQNYIRACLVAFGRLAGMYDNASMGINAPTVYRVNLMLKPKKKIASILSSLYPEGNELFFLKVSAKESYKLFLKRQYSVQINNDDKSLLENEKNPLTLKHDVKKFPEDSAISNIILPVYELGENSDCYNCIGAPRAIQSCQPQFIRNTTVRVDEWKTNEGAPDDLYQEAKEYYSKDSKGKSIISFPLSTQRYAHDSLTPNKMSGVLNIYRNSPDMFSGDDEKFDNFFHLTSPLLISLCRIVEYHLIALSFDIKK